MNNTSDINDCISIDSDYEGVASLSNSSVYNNVNSNDNLLRIVCLNCCGIKTRLQYPEFRTLIQSYDIVCFVLDLFEKEKYSCCNSLKASSDEYLVYSGGIL
jgi:hypothetical protein